MPAVSVIIPTFNRARFVVEAVESVLSQSYGDFEVVVVDDGSTDDTVQALQRIQDPRVRRIQQANAGRSAARNRGFAASTGGYVVFLDDDDLFLPRKLEWQVDFLNDNPDAGMVVSGFHYVDVDGKILKTARPWVKVPVLDWRNCVHHYEALHLSAVLIRRPALECITPLFDRTLEPCEDTDFFVRLRLSGCEMAWLKEPVCCYRQHGTSTVGTIGGEVLRMTIGRALATWFAREDLPPEMLEERRDIEARFDLFTACRAYQFGEIAAGQRLLKSALNAFPAWGSTLFPETVARFVGFVESDPRRFVETVFQNLPAEHSHLASLKTDVYRRFLTRVTMAAKEGEGPLGEPD